MTINGKTADNFSSDCEQVDNLPIPHTQEFPFVVEMTIFLEYKGWFVFFFSNGHLLLVFVFVLVWVFLRASITG